MISSVQAQNQISSYNERVYHQSNLVGDWKGNWSNNHQAVEFAEIKRKWNARTMGARKKAWGRSK